MEEQDLRKLMFTESAAKELEAFASQEQKALTDTLCKILISVAKTGLTCWCWEHLRVLLRFVLNKNLIESNERVNDCGEEVGLTFEERRASLLGSLDSFVGPPFTLQRLCELLIEPQLYTSTKKYLNALEKMFAVSQTLSTLSPTEYDKEVSRQIANFQAVASPNENTSASEQDGSSESSVAKASVNDSESPVDMEL